MIYIYIYIYIYYNMIYDINIYIDLLFHANTPSAYIFCITRQIHHFE